MTRFGRFPKVCGLHRHRVHEAYVRQVFRPGEETNQALRRILKAASGCHYCLRLRSSDKPSCCSYHKAPSPGHEHRWKDRRPEYLALAYHVHINWHGCSTILYCEDCGAEVWTDAVFAPTALLHGCTVCGKVYRSGYPLSRFCSWTCVEKARSAEVQRRIDRLFERASDPMRSADRRLEVREDLAEAADDETLEDVERNLAQRALERLLELNQG